MYLTLMNIYLEDNNKFDQSLMKCWLNEIKPYILKNYPVSIKSNFNTNSDLMRLIELIDKYKIISIEEKQINNNNKIIDEKQKLTIIKIMI